MPLARVAPRALVASLLAGVLAAPTAHAQYRFTTIDVPGELQTFVEGINNAGQIVGFSGATSGNFFGFLYNAGAFTPIVPPGATHAAAFGINDVGQIVGENYPALGNPQGSVRGGFMRSNAGVFTPLNVPDAYATSVYDINNAGRTVGQFDVLSPDGLTSITDSFLYDAGVLTPFSVPGASETFVRGINDAGQIVGTYRTPPGDDHGFLYSGGVFTPIDVPGATITSVDGINDAGTIVGTAIFDGPNGRSRGFVRTPNGTITFIDVPTATGTGVRGINDVGQIVGWHGSPSAPGIHGFLATPTAVPEPATLALVAGGLLGLGAVARRRQAA